MTEKNTPTTPTESPDLPNWIVVLVVLVCLLGGGALTWWYFSGPPRVIAVAVPEREARPNRGPGRARPAQNVNWSGDIRERGGSGRFQVRTKTVQVWATPAAGKPASFRFYYRNELLPREQMNILRAPALAGIDREAARLKLTPQQRAELKGIDTAIGLQPSDADLKRVQEAWDNLKPSPARATEPTKKAFLDLIEQLGTQYLDATKSLMTANVERIKKILTPEQQKLLETRT
jgi:hypothetical protein